MNDTEIRVELPHEFSRIVPPWVLRFAYDGEEWLVLADEAIDGGHDCGIQISPRFWVDHGNFERCWMPGCEGQQLDRYPDQSLWEGDSETEAIDAFKLIEAEWRAAKAG